MNYFNKKFVKFFRELEKNNNRNWFKEHKDDFDHFVHEPFILFISDLISEIQKKDSRIQITPKEAMFRIYRDIRFSKDKTPYKTFISAIISQGGRKNMLSQGLYLELSSKGIQIYGGIYRPDAQTLKKVRTYIAKDPSKIEKILKSLKFKKHFGELLKGETNKRIDTSLQEVKDVFPEIMYKSFIYGVHLNTNELCSEHLMKTILKYWDASTEMRDYFEKALA